MGSVHEGTAPESNGAASGSSSAASRDDDTAPNSSDLLILLTNLNTHFIPQCKREWNGETAYGTWKCVYCGVNLTVRSAKSWDNSSVRAHYNEHCNHKIVPELQSTIDKLTAEKDKLISRLQPTKNDKLISQISQLQLEIDNLKAEKDNIIPHLPSTTGKLTADVRILRRVNCRLRQDIQCLSGRDWRQCWCGEGEARCVNCPFGHVMGGDDGEHLRTARNVPLQTDDDELTHQMKSW